MVSGKEARAPGARAVRLLFQLLNQCSDLQQEVGKYSLFGKSPPTDFVSSYLPCVFSGGNPCQCSAQWRTDSAAGIASLSTC